MTEESEEMKLVTNQVRMRHEKQMKRREMRYAATTKKCVVYLSSSYFSPVTFWSVKYTKCVLPIQSEFLICFLSQISTNHCAKFSHYKLFRTNLVFLHTYRFMLPK